MTGDSQHRLTRRAALQGLGAVGATALAGCSSYVPGASGESSLRYAQVLPALTLDPVRVADPWSEKVAGQVFQGLYAHDREMNLVPVLANGDPSVSDDGRTYTVELADGPTFQNGDPVTAEDVKYSFEAPVEEDRPGKWQVDMVEAIETPAERTVRFELEHPYPAFDHALTRGIVPKSLREANPDAFANERPVGSGPYEVGTFKPAKYAILSARDDYWGEPKPAVDTAEFIGTYSGLARTMSLKTDQTDVVERVQPRLWDVTDGFAGSRVRKARGYHYHYVGFNCNDGPAADPRVREAVDYLVDMDEVVKHLVEPIGRRQPTPLPGQVAADWNLPVEEWSSISRSKNVEAARRLFAAADVSSWSPTIAVPKHDLLREKVGEEIAHGLNEAGFARARVDKYPWSEFRDRIVTGSSSDYDVFVGAWLGGRDPDTYLYPLLHENNEGLTNGTFYRNQDVMTAIRKARRTTDRRRRRRLYESVIETVLHDRPHLPAFTLDATFGVENRVHGFDAHPLASANPRLVGPKHAVTLDE
ncbi:ABC transporter substrate-binding protein [Halobacteriaceae archaeon GCM10025711]